MFFFLWQIFNFAYHCLISVIIPGTVFIALDADSTKYAEGEVKKTAGKMLYDAAMHPAVQQRAIHVAGTAASACVIC
jgi:hypothetical protein